MDGERKLIVYRKENYMKNKYKVYIPLFTVITIVLILGWFWYKEYSKYISTDDAYVESDNVSVSSNRSEL